MKKRNKVKPGEVRITPIDNRLLDMPPYLNTVDTQPLWVRMLSKEKGSLRRCAGVNDFLQTGLTIPCWTNFTFRPHGDNTWETRGDEFGYQNPHDLPINAVQGFPFYSTGECPVTKIREEPMNEAQYIKLVNPWRIETAPGWSTLFLPMLWEPNNKWETLPAIVHTDFYHLANVVVNAKTSEAFTIKWGTPLAHLIPFKRTPELTKLIMEDESQFKYVASRGFGAGSIFPKGASSAAPYRRERLAIDRDMEQEKSSKLIDRILNRFGG